MVVAVIPNYLSLVKYYIYARGIVSASGGPYMWPILVSIRMLGKTNSDLSVEIFLPGEKDYDAYICDEIQKDLNARCIVLPRHENFATKRYQYKAVVILSSSFEDILFLDADNLPLIDPNELFDSSPFITTGLVTWPDFCDSSASPLYYRISTETPPLLILHATTEAGQIPISKRKHAAAILFATYYNLYGPKFSV
jgi:alpha 1,2-mannosyltransferase